MQQKLLWVFGHKFTLQVVQRWCSRSAKVKRKLPDFCSLLFRQDLRLAILKKATIIRIEHGAPDITILTWPPEGATQEYVDLLWGFIDFWMLTMHFYFLVATHLISCQFTITFHTGPVNWHVSRNHLTSETLMLPNNQKTHLVPRCLFSVDTFPRKVTKILADKMTPSLQKLGIREQF